MSKTYRAAGLKSYIDVFQHSAQPRHINTRPRNTKEKTVRAYEGTISKFVHSFGDAEIDAVGTDDVQSFLNGLTDGRKQQTKKIRYSHLKAFFNFTKANLVPGLHDPCDKPIMKKLFRPSPQVRWDILEKETVDEIIFRTIKVRNRLILELMARGAMRIGEVLKLTLADISGRKLILRAPKSGKAHEFVFIPQKVADRLYDYAKTVCAEPRDRIFSISYEAARAMVANAGKLEFSMGP